MEVKTRLGIIIAELKSIGIEINQNKLANKVGVSSTTMSSIVRGKSLPSLPVALKIAKELNKPIEEIWELLDS